MRFLADENIPGSLVRALAAEGHDVASVSRETGDASDPVVLDRAIRETRVLLTFDKDWRVGAARRTDERVRRDPATHIHAEGWRNDPGTRADSHRQTRLAECLLRHHLGPSANEAAEVIWTAARMTVRGGRRCQKQPWNKTQIAAGGEDEVRFAGELGAVEAEAVAEAVGQGADEALGGRALGADAGHAFRALGGG